MAIHLLLPVIASNMANSSLKSGGLLKDTIKNYANYMSKIGDLGSYKVCLKKIVYYFRSNPDL